MNITNRTGYKGSPWQGPMATGNVFDFMLRMRTQLSLWPYRDQMVNVNNLCMPFSPHCPPQGSLRGMVEGLLQVHKANVLTA